MVPSDWPDVLDAAERARSARFAFEADRRRYVVAHVLARKVLADHLGAGPSDLRFTTACARCGGPHGKPALAGPGAGDVEFSISHSGDWAVVGVARGVQIGVDVERILPSIAELAATHGFLAPVERHVVLSLPFARRAFAVGRYWVRKEATLKASGDGLAVPPAALTVSPPAEPAAVLAYGSAWTSGPVRLHDLAAREGHLGSVAVLSDSAPIVVEHEATAVIGVGTRGISTVLTESLDTRPNLY